MFFTRMTSSCVPTATCMELIKSTLWIDGLFWLFSGVSIFAMLFAYFRVSDTFGKTLEDIEDHYRRICSHSNLTKNTKTDTGSYNMGYIID